MEYEDMILWSVLGLTWIEYVWELYLSLRQHKMYSSGTKVPKELEKAISKELFDKSRLYGLDKSKFGFIKDFYVVFVSSIMIKLLYIYHMWQWSGNVLDYFNLERGEIKQTAIFVLIMQSISTLMSLPVNIYDTFVLEEKHGFNKQTCGFFIKDKLKGFAVSQILVTPLTCVAIYIVKVGGDYFFLYLWVFTMVMALFFMTVYPEYIAPLFDKYTPLTEGKLRSSIEELASINFPLYKLYLVEGDEVVERDKDLYDAIEKGDLRAAKQIVQSGADLNSPHKSGFTALHIAAAKGHLDLLKFLVEQNIDINAKNAFGRTALHEATLAEQKKAVQILIDLGANITLTDYTGQTPLHEAANSGNLDLLKILIKHCDIEARDNWNRTALYKAVEKGNLEAVKFLIENKADPYVKGLLNSNLMHIAAENGRTSTVIELSRYKELINAKNTLEDAPLYYALDSNHSETVYALVDMGAEIQRDYLWKALIEFNYEILKFLIKKTGEVNARYPSMEGCGNTILMDVVGSTRYKPKEAMNIIQFLLDRNADVNFGNCDNLTALHVAAINRAEAPLLNLLIDKGANINAEDSHGDTPLALALGSTAEILRKLGALTKDEM